MILGAAAMSSLCALHTAAVRSISLLCSLVEPTIDLLCSAVISELKCPHFIYVVRLNDLDVDATSEIFICFSVRNNRPCAVYCSAATIYCSSG